MSHRILFDTNAYSYFIRNRAEAIEVLQLAERIGLPLIVIADLMLRRKNHFMCIHVPANPSH
jgi:predicted nucleic acid-binding protein